MLNIISLFKSTYDLIPEKDIEVGMFLDFVKDGHWQDVVLKVRTIEDKKERDKFKVKNAPSVTISGRFTERRDSCIINHSGLIAIDFDNVEDIEKTKDILAQDKYCYAIFTSISGRGLCMLVKIDGSKHREAFEGLQQYMYQAYGLVVEFDVSVKNESRIRYVSFDPFLRQDEKSSFFRQYIKKNEPPKLDKIIYVENDFDGMIKEIEVRKISICDRYPEWLRCGFALAEKLGEGGRAYYHTISQFSASYAAEACDKQYSNCLKAQGTGTSIATLYYYAKKAGITLYSKRTQLIASIASASMKTGHTKEDTVKNIVKHEGIEKEDCEDIVRQVFENKIEILSEESVIIDIQNWLKHNYDLKLNEITQCIECEGKQLTDTDFNSIFVKAKIVFDKDASTQLLKEILLSNFVTQYNPIHEFFRDNEDKIPLFMKDEIPQVVLDLWDSIETDDKEYMIKYGTKWFVGIISAAYYTRSPLMMIFCGNQGGGKTEFIERVLPKELIPYLGFPDINGDAKDLKIALSSKLIIIDDEVGGKSKKEENSMKSLLSSPGWTIRRPFGHAQVDIKRLAVFFGTSNLFTLLSDPTGNRRFIPINVISRDFKKFDRIDKVELFMAFYQMWKNGFDWTVKDSDIAELKQKTVNFEKHSGEYELIMKFFSRGEEEMSSTEIKEYLETKTTQKVGLNRLGEELKSLGYTQKMGENEDGKSKRCWLVKRKEFIFNTNVSEKPPF